MRDFNQNRFGGGNRFEKRNSDRPTFNRRESGPREMFHAVCDNCGKDCEVPFKPSGNKEVFCSDCFEKMGGKDNRREEGNRDFRKPSFERRDNARDDWTPRSNSSERAPESSNNDYSALKQQLEAINTKLGMVLKALENQATVKPQTVSEAAPKAVKVEVKEKAAKKPAAKKKKAE